MQGDILATDKPEVPNITRPAVILTLSYQAGERRITSEVNLLKHCGKIKNNTNLANRSVYNSKPF
jgi:hypothetical protein